MADRPAGAAPARLVAVLGPTNTGKTHYAVERMLGHASGMIGLPLRLLAREVYDRIVKLRGARAVALITGEEKITPPRATYFVCTVEAMPLGREVEFLAVDEIQLCADPSRGHVFTDRLLHARGTAETLLLGALTAGPLIRRLCPDAEFVTRERFSTLAYMGSKKLTRLPRRTAVVAFSAENVYAIAELIRRQRGGAAVVMGSLSPRTRNAQVALYQEGEVDFLVATDAIGMGLNMDVDHVAFAGLRKFDGKRTRWLTPQEVGQIAGRAGRYTRDGTFGVTGDAPEMDEDLVGAVEQHHFHGLEAAEWRNARLEFDSLPALQRSLAKPPRQDGLKLASEAVDETTLRLLAGDPDIETLARGAPRLRRLWEVCQTPDFRKTTLDEHVRLAKSIYEQLTSRAARLSEDWMADHFRAVDNAAGEIDLLSQRLAAIRTLAYIAARPDWLRDPPHWQAKTRALEDRLSDTLHERLMQRFIDRRTSALLRGLNLREDVLAGVGHDGAVTVEGHDVGRLVGVRFEAAKGASALEDKALRHAAVRAVAPLLARRLGELAASPDADFALREDGALAWRGEPAGALGGGSPFAPIVSLPRDIGDAAPGLAAAFERAQRRLEAFVAARSAAVLAPLKTLDEAMASGALRGLARGVAFRLREWGGVMDRRVVANELAQLSQGERRALRALGVRFGAFSLFLPGLQASDARAHLAAFAHLARPDWRPPHDAVTALPADAPSPAVLAAHGLRAVGGFAVPVHRLEALDAALRAQPAEHGGVRLSDAAAAELGWSPAQAAHMLKSLGFARASKPEPERGGLWRLRKLSPSPVAAISSPDAPSANSASPFAALGGLRLAAGAASGRAPRARAPRLRRRTGQCGRTLPAAESGRASDTQSPAEQGVDEREGAATGQSGRTLSGPESGQDTASPRRRRRPRRSARTAAEREGG